MLLSDRACGFAAAALMNNAENDRNKYQSCDRCETQTADDGPAERGVLLAAFAQPERHREHADDHGERGHQDRAQTDIAGLDGGCDRITVLLELFLGEADD